MPWGQKFEHNLKDLNTIKIFFKSLKRFFKCLERTENFFYRCWCRNDVTMLRCYDDDDDDSAHFAHFHRRFTSGRWLRLCWCRCRWLSTFLSILNAERWTLNKSKTELVRSTIFLVQTRRPWWGDHDVMSSFWISGLDQPGLILQDLLNFFGELVYFFQQCIHLFKKSILLK